MQSWGSYSYAFGPLVALGAVLVLIGLLRWAFSRGHSVVASPVRAGSVDEYGLLTAVAEPGSLAEAEIVRLRLAEVGIRATVAGTVDGPRVMVWEADAGRARQALRQTR